MELAGQLAKALELACADARVMFVDASPAYYLALAKAEMEKEQQGQ